MQDKMCYVRGSNRNTEKPNQYLKFPKGNGETREHTQQRPNNVVDVLLVHT